MKKIVAAILAASLSAAGTAQLANERASTDANEATAITGTAQQDAAAEAAARAGWWAQAQRTRDQRLAWWRDARFGAFVHWGPYSVLGGKWRDDPPPGYAEHIMRTSRIPLATYRDEVAAKFRPAAFDAKAWIAMMKAAGMRYVIVTAKHHDGFALWPSRASSFNIRDVSRFDRDPLGEIVTAARAAGLRVGFYYSHAFDWEDADAPGNDWDYANPGGDKLLGGADWWRRNPAFLANTDRYIKRKVVPQLQELIARYHPDILWFDTPHKLPFFQQAQIVAAVRAADPRVIVNGRAANRSTINLGDYLNTADRPAELRPTPGDWEAIPTTNESYGYSAYDHRHKTAAELIRVLVRAVAKGGNILLNIGPRGDGTIDPPDVAILRGIAVWMAVNGDSIHGAGRTPLDRQPWGDSTLKGDRLYLHVLHWPGNRRLVIDGLLSNVRSARLLTSKGTVALAVRRAGPRTVEITVPASAPDPVDSVIALDSAGPVATAPGRTIDTAFGDNQLLAFDAKAQGTGFTYGDGKTGRYYVDGLERAGNSLSWQVGGSGPARLRVRYSTVAPDRARGRFVLRYGGKTLSAPIVASKDATLVDLGMVPLSADRTGRMVLTIEGAPADAVNVFELLAGPVAG